MFFKLLKFECFYHSRQISFIVFSLLFMGYGILASVGTFQYLEFSSMYNDGYNLSLLSSLISIFSVFPIMLFCINGIQRDKACQSEEIIFSTGIQKIQFFLSRFLGVFLMALLMGSISLFGVYIGTLLTDLDSANLHSFEVCHYVWPWLVIILPNTFIFAAILFSVSALFQQDVSTYLAGGVLMLWVLVSCYYINAPLIGGASLSSQGILDVVSISDVSGLTFFFEQTQFLTSKQKNDYLISLSGHSLWNRLIWVMLSFALLILSYRLFLFRKAGYEANRKKPQADYPIQNLEYVQKEIETHRFKFIIATFKSITILNVKTVIGSIPFLSIIVVWILVLLFTFSYTIEDSGIYGGKFPTTDLLLSHILEALPAMGILLISFYSGELVWKARKYRFNEIVNATPVKSGVLLSSVLLSLILIPFFLILVAVVMALLFQIYHGYYDFKIELYFSLFYYGGAQLVLYAVFTLLIQSLVSNKYLGMIISGLVLLLFGPLSSSIGLEHPLLLFNNLPNMARAYSDFTGYGEYASKFHWMTLYWSILACVIILCTYVLWNRSQASVARKLYFAVNDRKISVAFCLLFLLLGAVGACVFYRVNIQNEYITSDEVLDFNEHYERKYKQYDTLAVPQIVSVKTKLDLFPKENQYKLEAHNIIANKSPRPMGQIFVTAPKPLQSLSIENSEQIFHDSLLNTYLFRLNMPIMPNEELEMKYSLVVKSEGFKVDHDISSNGSYIKSTQFAPWLGYVNEFEISSNYERKLRGLPEKNNQAVNDEHLNASAKFNFENAFFETVISTSDQQTAFTSGGLIRQWNSNDRNYYHYKSNGKINNIGAYFSASYKVEKLKHRGINIEFYYLPEHYRNMPEMISVTKATIDYCTDNFGKYPYKQLRIGEMPVFGGANGQAMPGVISVNEKVFKRDVRDSQTFNSVARVIIHEISHQWWGYLLTPKRTEGFMLLSESFAKYSEMVILEKLYGREMSQRLSNYSIRRYFGRRSYSHEAEEPLYLAKNQQHVAYSKGAVVMSAIRELIGEDSLNTALSNLIAKHRHTPTATSLDFLEELYTVTSQENHTLIEDWLKKVVTYDLSLKSASHQKLSNGRYKIKGIIAARRFETNYAGEEIEIDVNEPIQIGFLGDNKVEEQFLESLLINNSETVFEIESDGLPSYIVIDPYHTRLDKNLKDNFISILQQ